MSSPALQSPCVQVCTLDPRTSQCVGCWRTLEEIASWTSYNDAEREAVLAQLPARKQAGETKQDGEKTECAPSALG